MSEANKEIQAAPKLQYFDPELLVVNPAIRARRGEPNKDKVEKLAGNMLGRRESGQPHQIQPGVVRILTDDKGTETVEIIAGDHRRSAEAKLNANLPAGEDKFLFLAIAVPATDTQALLDALDENEFRVDSTVFDRADSWSRLVALGFTQATIATRYDVAESTVSDTIRCAKLPKKIQAAVTKGELTEEGAIKLARYNKDTKLQDELFALSAQIRQARESIDARAEARSKGEPEPEAADAVTDPGKPASKGSAPKSDATRRGGKKATPGRTTGGDVGAAIKQKKAGKRKTTEPTGKSKKDLLLLLEAKFGEKVEDTVPEPYRELAAALEEYFDGGLGDQAFLNRWKKCLREKFVAVKAAD